MIWFYRKFCLNSHLIKCRFNNLIDMRISNYTELRKNLSAYLDSVIDDSETVVITRDGNDAVVMISLDEYNAIKETAYLMQSPAMIKAIRKGIEDAENGRSLSQEDGESVADFLNRV